MITWTASIFILSALLLGSYYLLVWLQAKPSSRYLFLKVSFLALPILPFLLNKINSFNIQFYKPLISLPASSLVMSGFQQGVAQESGWFVTILLSVYGLYLLRELLALAHSIWKIQKIKRSSRMVKSECGMVFYLHDFKLSPVTAGLFKPQILISRTTLSSVSKTELEIILRHENVHVVRRDTLHNFFRLMTEKFLLFSPFAILLSRAFENEMELSVDEALIDTHGVNKRDYATLLLKLCTADSDSFGVGLFKSKSILTRRVKNMKFLERQKAKPVLVSAIFVIFLSLSAIALPMPEMESVHQFLSKSNDKQSVVSFDNGMKVTGDLLLWGPDRKSFKLMGRAMLTQGDYKLTAEQIEVDPKTGKISALLNAYYQHGTLARQGVRLDFKITDHDWVELTEGL